MTYMYSKHHLPLIEPRAHLRGDSHYFAGNWLIFGGAGFLGQALVRELVTHGGYHWSCVVASRDEAKHVKLRDQFESVKTRLCDVRDIDSVRKTIMAVKPTRVVVASALKQIDACESNPEECIKTNILGLQNILNVLAEADWNFTFVFVSTDKACNPTNIYGCSKSLGEKLVLAANKGAGTRYRVVRYGNVFGSTGSIFPRLMSRKADGKKFCLTHRDMTRFLMTADQAVNAVHTSMYLDHPGIYVPCLYSHKITDLMETLGGSPDTWNISGPRPGEKLHETLLTQEEAPYSEPVFEGRATNDHLPPMCDPGFTLKGYLCNTNSFKSGVITNPMVSNDHGTLMTKEVLAGWLEHNGFLEPKGK